MPAAGRHSGKTGTNVPAARSRQIIMVGNCTIPAPSSTTRYCELHRDWRNDIEGLGTLFANHIPDYRNLITSYNTMASGK